MFLDASLRWHDEMSETHMQQQLHQMRVSKRLPHALLFKGAKGAGKLQCAQAFMQALLCLQNNADGTACHTCHGCRQVLGSAHPDMMVVTPEKKGHAIKVDQIRELNDFVRQSSLQGGYRVVIIHPADAMNVNAANALLKTLEEPARDALLILVSDQSSQLPATILSRCQFIRFSSATQALDEQQSGLQKTLQDALGHSSPDPLKLAESLQSGEPLTVIDGYIHWLLTQKSDLAKITTLMKHAQQIRKHLCDGINLNKQLMLEDLFIRWTHYANSAR